MIKIVINEEQFKTVLQEELGISEIVYNISLNIYDNIVNTLADSIKEKHEFVTIKTNKFKYVSEEFKIDVSYKFYNYNESDLQQAHKNGWSVDLGKNRYLMFIELFGVSGTINKENAMDVIQHEVEHIYQQYKAKKPFGDNAFYAKIKTNLESNNDDKRMVARLIYGCVLSEQEGYLNGLYSYLMALWRPYNFGDVQNSDCWQLYNEMLSCYDKLKNNPELTQYLSEYNLSMKKIESNINRFINKIGRVVCKVKKDKYLQGWRE